MRRANCWSRYGGAGRRVGRAAMTAFGELRSQEVVPGPMKPSLAPLQFRAERSLGRRYPEPPHPYRNEFQRDRDRIVHARAFRRLEDKTQVFTPALSDHFRNRLTHTIEVAQVARTAAGCWSLNEHLTEALALAHDIGHPPFAHAGEEELNRQMRRFGDRLRPQPARPANRGVFRAALRAFPGSQSQLRSARGNRQAFPRFCARRDPRTWMSTCPGCGRRSRPS